MHAGERLADIELKRTLFWGYFVLPWCCWWDFEEAGVDSNISLIWWWPEVCAGCHERGGWSWGVSTWGWSVCLCVSKNIKLRLHVKTPKHTALRHFNEIVCMGGNLIHKSHFCLILTNTAWHRPSHVRPKVGIMWQELFWKTQIQEKSVIDLHTCIMIMVCVWCAGMYSFWFMHWIPYIIPYNYCTSFMLD